MATCLGGAMIDWFLLKAADYWFDRARVLMIHLWFSSISVVERHFFFTC